jgi:hypothetical protein
MNQESIPESRSYRHSKCNGVTVVSGQPFEVMSNPLSDMSRTWCSECSSFFPLSEYEWVDSGEEITKYYARHSASASSVERFLCSKKFLVASAVVGFLLGAIGGFFLFRNNALWLKIFMTPFVGFIGVFIAAALNVSVIGKIIVRRVCGVKDTRILK